MDHYRKADAIEESLVQSIRIKTVREDKMKDKQGAPAPSPNAAEKEAAPTQMDRIEAIVRQLTRERDEARQEVRDRDATHAMCNQILKEDVPELRERVFSLENHVVPMWQSTTRQCAAERDALRKAAVRAIEAARSVTLVGDKQSYALESALNELQRIALSSPDAAADAEGAKVSNAVEALDVKHDSER